MWYNYYVYVFVRMYILCIYCKYMYSKYMYSKYMWILYTYSCNNQVPPYLLSVAWVYVLNPTLSASPIPFPICSRMISFGDITKFISTDLWTQEGSKGSRNIPNLLRNCIGTSNILQLCCSLDFPGSFSHLKGNDIGTTGGSLP